MKLNKLVLAIGIACVSVNAVAAPQVVYDNDGFKRDSAYNQGPVTTISTAEVNYGTVKAYVRHGGNASCTEAGLYNAEDGTLINPGRIGPFGTPLVDQVETGFDERFATVHKYLQVQCTDLDGQQFAIRHNIPRAPKMTWDATLTPNGYYHERPTKPWEPGYPYQDQFEYSGILSVTNYATDGVCYISQDHGRSLEVFNGENSKYGFDTDVFTGQKIHRNELPNLYQEITCRNAGGTTVYSKVWDLTQPDSIPLDSENISYR
ncbi:hypothetical protein GCM10009092_28740 [Bowmanella denitrificans]|uniref:Secreted protein n=1 Tax=Bowmanella denitrificans TaxID=366582 RepID=A0ABN0XF76_9ALTE|nr:hypothetical protein [Bowmanella denitrificans]